MLSAKHLLMGGCTEGRLEDLRVSLLGQIPNVHITSVRASSNQTLQKHAIFKCSKLHAFATETSCCLICGLLGTIDVSKSKCCLPVTTGIVCVMQCSQNRFAERQSYLWKDACSVVMTTAVFSCVSLVCQTSSAGLASTPTSCTYRRLRMVRATLQAAVHFNCHFRVVWVKARACQVPGTQLAWL